MGRLVTIALLVLACLSSAKAESAREYFKFAKFSYDAKDYTKALEFVNKAIELESDYINGLVLRAEINQHLENFYAVIVDANKIIDTEHQATSISSQTHILRAIAHYHLNHLEEATSDLKSSLTLNPGNATAYFYKGLISYQKASLFQALENFDLAIKNDAQNFEYYYFRAKTKKENYNPIPNTPTFENIMTDIDKAISLNPEDFRAYKLRCDMLKLNVTNARDIYIDELSKTIELFPEQADFYAQRGMAKILDYQFVDALEDLDMAIAINGANELTLRNRALCYHNLSNYKDAIKDYTLSIDIMINKYQQSQEKRSKKMLAETLVMRGRTYQQIGNPDEACTDFYNAAKLGSKTGLNNYRRNCNVYN